MKNTPERFEKKLPESFRPEFWQKEIKEKEEIANAKAIELQNLEQLLLNTGDPGERLRLNGLITRIKGEISMAEAIRDISKSQIAENTPLSSNRKNLEN